MDTINHSCSFQVNRKSNEPYLADWNSVGKVAYRRRGATSVKSGDEQRLLDPRSTGRRYQLNPLYHSEFSRKAQGVCTWDGASVDPSRAAPRGCRGYENVEEKVERREKNKRDKSADHIDLIRYTIFAIPGT